MRAPRASDSTSAADVRDGVAEVEHVQHHVEEKHELEHDENAEPVHAAVHAGELARAVRMRERGPRAGKSAVRESLPQTPIMKNVLALMHELSSLCSFEMNTNRTRAHSRRPRART